jgi:hypothetical protein
MPTTVMSVSEGRWGLHTRRAPMPRQSPPRARRAVATVTTHAPCGVGCALLDAEAAGTGEPVPTVAATLLAVGVALYEARRQRLAQKPGRQSEHAGARRLSYANDASRAHRGVGMQFRARVHVKTTSS